MNHLVKNTVAILPKDIDILVPVLMNARVVLPTTLFEEENGVAGLVAKNGKNAVKNISPSKAILVANEVFVAKEKIVTYTNVLKELPVGKKTLSMLLLKDITSNYEFIMNK